MGDMVHGSEDGAKGGSRTRIDGGAWRASRFLSTLEK